MPSGLQFNSIVFDETKNLTYSNHNDLNKSSHINTDKMHNRSNEIRAFVGTS